MTGEDVLRDREELRPRVESLLDDGEQLQVVLRASSRPAKALKLTAVQLWPFFREADRFLLVATDRRWLVLESEQERYRGALTGRAALDREIRVETSWFTRFDGFDQPYAIDPIYALWAVAANDALDARRAGRPWDLAELAPRLSEADSDSTADTLAATAMKVGRFVPRRRPRG